MRKVLITGANKGLGFELAKYLLQQGYFVYLGCRNTATGNNSIAALQAEGLEHCDLIEIDVSDQASVTRAAEIYGRKENVLDILINNAGILGRRHDPAQPLNVADVRYVFETNFFGTIMTTEAFLPFLEKSKLAVIENITSDLASLTKHQDENWELYKAKSISYVPSKTALNAYTIALAYQYKDKGFKINCVTPGWTSTDFNGHSGGKSAAENCVNLAKYAMLDENGPTGQYFGEEGAMPW
ncbi:NAD(P)-dependent dehydrogenase (short-subunit alcohol dehydrogenase family) [Chitinophaga terrae (ex Kim and Jung 2007)]|uniref:SDR family NAD(P)-dependent oxidoreductase n=1 Tax=Chitinophaga terrae (ex Kim and Jung 2007) TaxID=408074 RepID=UPI00277F8A35|nr:SDR family NAD(P)-dependent oxidoreductase [Chitinophaga terrae (ex Kim and Jung 2007)]MDQ0106922.1 NAD(P)-dependent dehydrogenase (short-subunit alcohol dehydrogenase family) [Chitinophaga terrae (ex Kim and Jung 2007)]